MLSIYFNPLLSAILYLYRHVMYEFGLVESINLWRFPLSRQLEKNRQTFMLWTICGVRVNACQDMGHKPHAVLRKLLFKFRYDVALLKSEFKEQKQLSASILHGRLVAIVHEIVTSGYSVNVAGVISFTDFVQICYVG